MRAFHERLADVGRRRIANPFFRIRSVSGTGATIEGREVISYTSFDYLGLAGIPKCRRAPRPRSAALAPVPRPAGWSVATIRSWRILDDEIAQFLGTEAAVVFPSGYGTNASLFGHLFGEDDLILYDELAHNSIVQGAVLSPARRRPFPHNDSGSVDRLLSDMRGKYRRVVVAIEGVYSMDGDYPDLPRSWRSSIAISALLYVDEAHSVGVMGTTGRGICEHFGVDPAEGDLWMGTISKALASGGGYLAGRASSSLSEVHHAVLCFRHRVSPPNAAAALTAVRLMHEEPERVARLRERSGCF